MMNRKLAAAAFGVAMVAVLAAVSTQAGTSVEQTTYVTFSRSVSLPGVELTAGTYIFELAGPGFDRTLIRVMSRDRQKMYTQQFTLTVQRPASVTDNHGITFGEAPAGEAPPIKAWYASGEPTGHQFIYRR
jgi:hypothetical protein